jgi:tRNA(Ile)-lysidine synthase
VKLPLVQINTPSAIAFSGGGDSTALLHACRNHPHINHAFIIDHGLRGGSAAEAKLSADRARAMGYDVTIRRWTHSGVHSAIQVKARAYRYSAMGEMSRSHNLRNLLTAHTQDDQAETVLMRINRGSGWRGMAGMPPLADAPIWPALAGVSLHRPWLGVSRTDIRRYNAHHGLEFIDDPSNENADFARVRARQALSVDPDLKADLVAEQAKARRKLTAERKVFSAWLKVFAHVHPQGFVETMAVPPAELLRQILNVVSGRGGAIDTEKLVRLTADMSAPDFTAATLSGAWVIRGKRDGRHSFVYLRDRVAVIGRNGVKKLAPVQLRCDEPIVWDGRFYCQATTDEIRIEPAQGHLQTLRQLPDFKLLFELPAEARGTLPVFFRRNKPLGFGALKVKYVSSVSCSASRLQA